MRQEAKISSMIKFRLLRMEKQEAELEEDGILGCVGTLVRRPASNKLDVGLLTNITFTQTM